MPIVDQATFAVHFHASKALSQPVQHTVILPPLDEYQAVSALFSGVLPPAQDCVKIVDRAICFT
ncbi:hypothetical protein [Roseovarius mucosus]|uniref:hypothetical protein n=1 Tax=Roseovarius mucosus TaxID=215743 RepID=UPI00056631DF|nr:hypothetical protein [Roseovarius mucosus]